MRHCLLAAVLAGFGLMAQGQAQAQVTCTAPEVRVAWPSTDNPVWDMCYVAYTSSSGPRGSGLELRRVHYNGRLVLKKANAPMLFAEYTSSTCYRDWKDDPEPLIAMPSMRNQIGTLTGAANEFSPTTSCDRSAHPTISYGDCPFQVAGRTAADCFTGVAIENRGDHVVLTAHYNAAWYLYTSRFYFFADGSFSPEFGFGNRDGTGNGTTHWHHNYWRLDFDIDGASNDVILENDVVQGIEFATRRCNGGTSPSCATERRWTVRDTVTNRGYLLTPSSADYVLPTNQSGRGFHTVDVLGTKYNFVDLLEEQTDRGNSNNLGDCAFLQNNLANGEDLDGEAGAGADVVMYYRAGVRDMTSSPGPQNSMICKSVGPVFTPVGNWASLPLFADGFEETPAP
jgi:hypothetical protein